MEVQENDSYVKKKSKRPAGKRIVVEFNEASRSKFINGFKGCKKKRKKEALKKKIAKEKAVRRKFKSQKRKELLEKLNILDEPEKDKTTKPPIIQTLKVSDNVVSISEIDLTS